MATKKKYSSKSKSRFRLGRGASLLQASLVAIIVALVGLRLLKPSFAASGDHAKCISISSSKTTVKPRQTFTGNVTVANDGSTTWTKAGGYKLIDPYNTWHFTGNVFQYNHAADVHVGITFHLTLTAPSHTGTYNFGGRLGSIAKPAGFDNACPVVKIKVANPVVTHPHPIPTPTPSPGPTVPVPVPDKTPPSKPGNFSGLIDDTSKLVTLTWSASKDNKGVAGYQLERSTDNKKWKVLAKNVTKTTYQDSAANFSQHYYYRIKAKDTAGNFSKYATTDVTAEGFTSNVKTDGDSQVSSEDSLVTVNFPAGAVSAEQFCSVSADPNFTSPSIGGLSALTDPYTISCRDAAGKSPDHFDKPLSAKIQLTKELLNGFGSASYLGDKDDNWQPLTITSHDKKNLVDQVDLSDYTTFAIMGKPKHKSPVGAIITVLIILAVIAFGVIFFLKWRMRSKLQQQYDDYRKRSIGG